jgi:hypothetical protein
MGLDAQTMENGPCRLSFEKETIRQWAYYLACKENINLYNNPALNIIFSVYLHVKNSPALKTEDTIMRLLNV